MLDLSVQSVGGIDCAFVVVPAVIEYPIGWLMLELNEDGLTCQLQRLPLPELAELSRQSGEGQDWRAGRPEWSNFRIELG